MGKEKARQRLETCLETFGPHGFTWTPNLVQLSSSDRPADIPRDLFLVAAATLATHTGYSACRRPDRVEMRP